MSSSCLTVWVVEQVEPYTGVFVESLWISKELADQEVVRLEKKYNRKTWEVSEWPIGESPIQEDLPE